MTQRLIAAERRLPSPIAVHYWLNNDVGTGTRQSHVIDTLMARINTGLTVIRAIPGANTPVCGRSDLPATIAAARGMHDRLKELGLLGEADGFNLVITSTDKADDLAIGLKHIIGSLTSEEDQAFAAAHVIPIADPTAAWAYDLGILNVVKGSDGSIDPDKSLLPHGLISGRGAVVAKNGTVIFSVMEDKTSDFAKTTPESLASQIAALLEPIAGSKRPRKAA
jgi:peroxiredoxin